MMRTLATALACTLLLGVAPGASAAEEGVVLKEMAGKKPGDAESFQWVNLMRGDTALMSLVTHRYLATKPNELGPVTATAAGPTPARKGGVCFKWKAVD